MSKRKNILPQMFDIKPVNPDGSLNLKKIGKIQRKVIIPKKTFPKNTIKAEPILWEKNQLLPHRRQLEENRLEAKEIEGQFSSQVEKIHCYVETPVRIHMPKPENFGNPFLGETASKKERLRKKDKPISKRRKHFKLSFQKKRDYSKIANLLSTEQKFSHAASFACILILFSLTVPAFSLIQRALEVKTSLSAAAELALGQFVEAKDNLSSSQFDQAAVDFSESFQILSDANRDISKIGGNYSELLRFVPGVSKVASANYVVSSGVHFSLAGKSLAESAKSLSALDNPLDIENQTNQPSLTDLFLSLQSGIETANRELSQAEEDLNKVNIDDLPENMKDQFTEIKGKLPLVNSSLENFLNYSQIFLDVLGYNGPRKYLFLFENNQEMRATGGFIGSYGILDIANGRVKKLFVDDIYNPDGQLKAKVIPPAPIQKMSAVWTMHDANWFPNFPTSAEKVAWFYEKTGGPTVDGVIAITPELLRELLTITGPIEMPEYGKVIDASNFIEETQQEVEIDYDKELNQPKKFIADLTPKILDKVMSEKGMVNMIRTLKAFNSALSKRHLLLYSRNLNVQKLISGQKWSGEILNTDKDFLAVINTNINGYKTDGVIVETIAHSSEIQNDGGIIDTVSITRKHNGGNERYDWWNKVNGDWMRVYVPKDAKLIEVSGQTRELVPPALDYGSLGFKRDPQLQAEEDSTRIDEKSGTRIYDESNKTVFANWVYVSPGESVTVTYKYILPFRMSFDELHHPADSFSILYQKQSGSFGSKLVSEIRFPDKSKVIWRWPENLRQDGNTYKMETTLETDKFVGLAAQNEE